MVEDLGITFRMEWSASAAVSLLVKKEKGSGDDRV